MDGHVPGGLEGEACSPARARGVFFAVCGLLDGHGDPRGTALDPRGARPLKLALCGILAAVINIEEAKKTRKNINVNIPRAEDERERARVVPGGRPRRRRRAPRGRGRRPRAARAGTWSPAGRPGSSRGAAGAP